MFFFVFRFLIEDFVVFHCVARHELGYLFRLEFDCCDLFRGIHVPKNVGCVMRPEFWLFCGVGRPIDILLNLCVRFRYLVCGVEEIGLGG